jgi:hypothetical protein
MFSAQKLAAKYKNYYMTSVRFAKIVDGVYKNYRGLNLAVSTLENEFQDLEIDRQELAHFIDGLLGYKSSAEIYSQKYLIFNKIGLSIFHVMG